MTEKVNVRNVSKTKSNTQKTIFKMEQRGSYFVDANDIVKGRWGGFHELDENGPNGEAMYELYHDRYSKYVPINERGYFYNIFSCKKYDRVLKVTQKLFLCEKNGREGVIDINGKEILHTCYNKIRVLLGASFIVTCETGDFLYFPESKNESDLFDEISFCYHGSEDYLIIKKKDKYGLINRKGEIVVEPKYEKKEHRWGADDCELQVDFHGRKYDLPVYNDKFYGKIPIDAYEKCIEIQRDFKTIYIIQKDTKYGILKETGVLPSSLQVVIEPCLDDVLLNDDGTISRLGFIIGKKNNKFMLFDINSGKCIIKNCRKIVYGGIYFSFQKNNYSGFITSTGNIINTKEYDNIEGNNKVRIRPDGIIGSDGKWQVAEFFVTKNGKKGVLGYNGEIIIPCDYDEIKYKWGKVYEVVKDGTSETIDLQPDKYDSICDYEQVSPSYSRYRGSYAQDEMGYSDDDIDTIFDGDPSAYWNID